MNKVIIGGVLLALVLVGWLWLGSDGKVTNYPFTKEGTIVAFGDSLVAGVGAPAAENFVARLAVMLGEPIVNLGVAGNTTRDGLARLDAVKAENPRLVLVLLGGNDFLRKLPAEETFANLRKIILEIQKEGAVVVLLGVRGGLLTDGYEKEYRKLAKTTGSLYVPDVLDGLFGKTEYMSDSIHPNSAGYKIIAERVYAVVKGVMR